MANPKIFLDITDRGVSTGRIVIELFGDTTPIAAEAFRLACKEKKIENSDGLLHLTGRMFLGSSTILVAVGDAHRPYNLPLYIDENMKKEECGKHILKRGSVLISVSQLSWDVGTFVICLNDVLTQGQVVEGMSHGVVCGQIVDGMHFFQGYDGSQPTHVGVRYICPMVIGGSGQIIPKPVNPKIFFDMVHCGVPAGRIVIELFADTTPIAAEAFRLACTNGKKFESSDHGLLHFAGTTFRGTSPIFMVGDPQRPYNLPLYADENVKTKESGKHILKKGSVSISVSKLSWDAGMFLVCLNDVLTKGQVEWMSHAVVCGQIVDGMDIFQGYDGSQPIHGLAKVLPVLKSSL